jgi:NAD-dependent dihydropyrimidine dehydrogenase PreA subunit
MVREMVKIDEELCNGCGLCIPGCHEGALRIIDGKARLISELMCDGLGACIGHCPQGAITIEKRESEAYLEPAVMETTAGKGKKIVATAGMSLTAVTTGRAITRESELKQWPVQMHLINPQAPCFSHADVVIAADCVAYAVGDFHARYLAGKSLAIACPKLDSNMEVYVNKITAMIDYSTINTITVMIMQVPCCGGLLQIVKAAVSAAQRKIPVKLIVVGIDGHLVKEEWVYQNDQEKG